VDADGCAVQHPALNAVITATLAEASAAGIAAYDERTASGELRYLVARYSARMRRVVLVLVSAGRDDGRLRALSRRLARRCPALCGIVLNHNAERGNVIFGRRFSTLHRSATLIERCGFLELQASPASFLQPNSWTARRIYETALAWAAPQTDDIVVDLFCGIGQLSLYLATRARLVVGVEESPSAVRDARANQRRNAFHNVRFEQGRAEAVLPRLRTELGNASIVTLNPTRKGAAPAVLDAIAALGPRSVVYVSCDADTLARDLERFAALGYRTARAQPFDMLPQTEHVEVVALLERPW
jgi:23S rRNA (uracil1939-C5)-methyltransferase